VRLNGS
jgi:hypothetical protein